MRFLLILLLLALSGCIGTFTGETDVAAPAFQVTDTDNVTHTQQHDGVLLLDFMGTWCGPCQRGVPDLRDMLANNDELKILSIASPRDSAEDLRQFKTQFGATWPIAVDSDSVVLRYHEAVGESGVIWPSYAVVKEGKITFFNDGETLPQTLADATGRGSGVQIIIVLTAIAVGLLAPLQPPVHKLLREQNRLAMAMATGGFLLLLSLFIIEYGVPITGRLRNAALIGSLGGLIGLAWWRRSTKSITPKSKGLELRAGYHFTWYALPAFLVAALAASLTTDQTAWFALVGFSGAAFFGVWRAPELAMNRAWLSYVAASLWMAAMWLR